VTEPLRIEVSKCGGPRHRADLRVLGFRGIPIPHQSSTWSVSDMAHDWRWCRAVDDTGYFLTGMAIQLSWSRAAPGTRIGRIERLGHGLDDSALARIGEVLDGIARSFTLLRRLDVEIFDEDAERFERFTSLLSAAGARRAPVTARSYARTLVLDLRDSDAELLASLQGTTRRSIEGFVADARTRTGPVELRRYASRLRQLHASAFDRTKGSIPRVDFEALIRDADEEGGSYLAGAFLGTREPPMDLVGFAWGRLHGDHVEYSAGATERAADLKGVATGQALVWDLCRWARERGATWLDLGGVIEKEADPSHPLQGISAFKRRFSRDERIVSAEYWFEPSPTLALISKFTRRVAALPGRPADTV
jgi:hypothetical protein